MSELSPVLTKLKQRFPGDVVSTSSWRGDDTAVIKREAITRVLEFCKDDPELAFNFLMDLSAVDYMTYPKAQPARFGVAYHLYSLSKNHRVRLKVFVNANEEIETACPLYKSANWMEREVFDQYGLKFKNHPNLKRILNHQEFVGHPLRKDYPMRKRQPLGSVDTLMDEMEKRLKAKGLR